MCRLCSLALLSLVWLPVVCLAQQAQVALGGGEWSGWRGPNRANLSPDTGLRTDWEATPPKLLWMAEGLGQGYASVSLSGGRIYTTGNTSDGQAVVALDAADGGLIWRTPVTGNAPKHGYQGSRSTPTIDGDRLYVVASSGAILCLRTMDGAILWSRTS